MNDEKKTIRMSADTDADLNKAVINERPGISRPEPRLFTQAQAAYYCALSCRGFAVWVKCGRMPGPIPGTTRWDRRAIDAALDEAMSKAANENTDTYDSWKARYHENKSKGNSYGKKETR